MKTSKLFFNKHIDVICKKANSALSLLIRNLRNSHPTIKSQVYQMYVRPILEYSSVVWVPHTKCNIGKVEAVQRRAARFATSDYSYTTSATVLTRDLNWKTLQDRRNIHRLIIFYKILHNMVNISLPESIIPSTTTNYTRGHNLRLYLPSAESMHTSTVSFLQQSTYGMNYLHTLQMHQQQTFFVIYFIVS